MISKKFQKSVPAQITVYIFKKIGKGGLQNVHIRLLGRGVALWLKCAHYFLS